MIEKGKGLHICIYKYHHDTGFNIYKQCRCGKRKVIIPEGGYQPIDKKRLKESS